MDFLGQVSKKFVGSGDPEISDAKDVVTYLSEKYTPAEWKNMLQELDRRALQVTGTPHPRKSPLSRMWNSARLRTCG